MSTVLPFRASGIARRSVQSGKGPCMIVIFPGIRIERHEQVPGIDLGHRIKGSAGRGDFDDLGGGHLPRKTS